MKLRQPACCVFDQLDKHAFAKAEHATAGHSIQNLYVHRTAGTDNDVDAILADFRSHL